MCGFNRKIEGDWSDARVTGNTDRTQQTIELVNRIEMLEKQLDEANNVILLCKKAYWFPKGVMKILCDYMKKRGLEK